VIGKRARQANDGRPVSDMAGGSVTLVRARALCFPAYDVGFARVVEAMLTDDPGITADALQTRLRNLAPATIVHARELSGERDQTLYVFRDGRWAGGVQSDWWQEKGVARVTVSIETGAVIDADRALLDLIGADRDWVIGRMYHEFVVPQARVASDALYQTALDTGQVHSVARVVGPNGRGVTVEFRAEVIGDQMVVAVRAAFLAQAPQGEG
jgi:PAS fold